MGCTSESMKCILNVMNFFMAIFGLALIALATLSLQTAPQVYIIYLYIVGGVNFVAALLGCCGICKEDICLTTTYAIIILASLISQVVGKFYASDSEAIKKFAADDVEKTWIKEITNPGAMDNTQQTFHCCGKNSPDDYYSIQRLHYPNSCYKDMTVNQTMLYNVGCISQAEKNFLEIFNYSSTGEWGNLVVTVIMFIFAIYLVLRFRRKQRRYNY